LEDGKEKGIGWRKKASRRGRSRRQEGGRMKEGVEERRKELL
jgi:hypothetical protein